MAGGETPVNPCADDVRDIDELGAKLAPQNDNDCGLKDQSLADIFWVLEKCPSSTFFLCCKLTELAIPKLIFLSFFLQPDSLEPLDLDVLPVRYQADDFILGDFENNWSRVMENSMDAFRNLSFLALDNNDSVLPIM